MTEETIASYVEHRIHNIFLAVAEMVNQGTIVVSEEESAGVPMKLSQGETLLMSVWKQYVQAEKLKEYHEDYLKKRHPPLPT